ncbi:MAG: YqaJ-like viral recombinase [Candidatus Symbiopectobacterium sp. Dall1.0]|nr:YqaJ-like viral recombinase [Candidatus Symbiopectobacterium sp. Dall1.0]
MIWHDIQQNTEEWEALRIGKATASNFGLIMANAGKAFGDPAKRYALQIALEQIKGCKSEFSFSNEHMERGHEQEPIARMLYEDMNFIGVDNGGFFDHETYGDSPDGLVGSDGVIEIKSVIASTHYATLERRSFDPSYRWQLISHLDCTGRDWVDFVSYCADFPENKQLIVHTLHRDDVEKEISQLQERRNDFLELVSTTRAKISDTQ